MAKTVFYILLALGFLLVAAMDKGLSVYPWIAGIYALYAIVGLYDLFLARHNVLRNYPVIGHLRYAFEFISPEIRQYFIETNESGRPYNRITRELVYARAEGKDDSQPFGTQYDILDAGYARANHSLAPKEVDAKEARVEIGGPYCAQPYNASRLNISAMSFGALSPNALLALNAGARRGGFAHNTGEGGLSPYHLREGGDIIWQIGTGYFGCRSAGGAFDPDAFKQKAAHASVKMVEIKLSQGAKPSHGGVLPAAKVNREIAKVRGVPVGEDVLSPPAHSAFSTPVGLMEFVVRLRDLSGGKPVGFKLCVGDWREFMGIVKAMLEMKVTPDFITVDGAEGGTGAAPVEYSNRFGAPANEGVLFVHNVLVGAGLRDEIKIISSGKVATGFDMVEKMALGADACNAARAMMFALGCIQALSCNTNACPTGIATQDRSRMKAVNVAQKKVHVATYHERTMKSLLDMVGAMGYDSPDQLTPGDIFRRIGDETERSFAQLYATLAPGSLRETADAPREYADAWEMASAKRFR